MNELIAPIDIPSFLKDRKKAYLQHLRTKGVDFPSAALLRNSVRLLNEEGTTLALDSDPEEDPVVDEGDMTCSFLITTPRKDRYGDIVLPRGCEPHISNYQRNPQVFFGHKSFDLPIARTEKLEITDAGIRATARFLDATEESRTVWKLVKNKILRSTSIGFLPIVASIIRGDEEEEDSRPKKDEEGNRLLYFEGWCPLKFKEWDLLEYSVVSVPANPDCCESLTKFLSDGKIEGEEIPTSIYKSLAPYALKGKIWSPGFDPVKVQYTGVLKMGDQDWEFDSGLITRIGETSLVEPTLDEPQNEEPTVVEIPSVGPQLSTSECVVFGVEELKLLQKLLSKDNLPSADSSNELCTLLTSIRDELVRHHQVEEAHQKLEEAHQKFEEAIYEKIVSLLEKKEPVEDAAPEPEVKEWSLVLNELKTLRDSQAKLHNKFFEMTGKRV